MTRSGGPEGVLQAQRLPGAVLDPHAQIRAINTMGCDMLGRSAASIVGRGMAEFHPEPFSSERLECVSRALASEAPVAVYGRLRGLLGFTTYIPITEELVLALFSDRHPMTVHPEQFGSLHVAGTRYADPGPLVELTERELQVLKLLGEGHSGEEMARRLHRSTRTIQWHRIQLGRKLNATNRLQLARWSHAAGFPAVPMDQVVDSIHWTGTSLGWSGGLPFPTGGGARGSFD